MSKYYDYAICIGRFSPPHNGHLKMLMESHKMAPKTIVLLGSPNSPRSIKNPFTVAERSSMLNSAISDFGWLTIGAVSDNMYNDDVWIKNVQSTVSRIISMDGWKDKPPKIVLVGHKKDDSSYYLNYFPQWDFREINPEDSMKEIHATDIRELIFDDSPSKLNYLHGVVPESVMDFIVSFRNSSEWKTLKEEFDFIQNYKKGWKVAPWPVTFVTCDAVVVQDGHVLMVKRKASPGKGLWALPGGFLNQNERIIDGCIRELMEETKIKVPEAVLRGSIASQHVFDHPNRSLRGRTITHAAYIKLKSVGSLPKIKASDDAASAKWIPFSEVKENECFEDHAHIITHFLSLGV